MLIPLTIFPSKWEPLPHWEPPIYISRNNFRTAAGPDKSSRQREIWGIHLLRFADYYNQTSCVIIHLRPVWLFFQHWPMSLIQSVSEVFKLRASTPKINLLQQPHCSALLLTDNPKRLTKTFHTATCRLIFKPKCSQSSKHLHTALLGLITGHIMVKIILLN